MYIQEQYIYYLIFLYAFFLPLIIISVVLSNLLTFPYKIFIFDVLDQKSLLPPTIYYLPAHYR